VVLVVAAGLCTAAVRAAAPVIESAARTAFEVVEITVITLASAGVLAGLGYVMHRQRAASVSHATARQAIPQHAPAAQALSAPQRPAIEAPRPSLTDLKSVAADRGYDAVTRAHQDDD
jgi:hypothetical protein